ncbi:MAG: ParB/RepB/Spo0J family partition protein [Chloroflexales bacterium]|nr:ParB/RepB/Spo0J family partition protein [Chloroflexales bacterium]
MPPKRPSLRDRASEFAQSDTSAARPDPELHGEERPRQDVISIPLREIMPNPRQPRTRFDEAALDELAESIREHGIIQPIIVKAIRLTNWEGAVRRYELIAGERRWRASERAGQPLIPAIIRDEASDTTLLELALIENLQRADLTPLEEAAAFGQMQGELGYTYEQIGQRVGKSKGYVMNRMRLLRLDDDLRDLVAERPDSLSHIIHLEKLPRQQREELVAAVRDDDLSVAELRRRAESFLRKNKHLAQGEGEPLPAPPIASHDTSELDKAPAATPSPFVRKNDGAKIDTTRAVLGRDIPHVRSVVQRWRQLPAPTPGEREEILAALDGLVSDLEEVMRHLQGQDGEG